MDELWKIIAELGYELHPDRIATIASKIESIDSIKQFSLVEPSFGPNIDRNIIKKLHKAWRNSKNIGSRELGAALRSASATASFQENSGTVDLVWTGPFTGMVPVRHTEQVLLEVISAATEKIFIVSFVAYQVETVMEALREAVARNVKVEMLLESSLKHGGKVNFDSIKAMKKAIPSVRIYVWKGEDKKDKLLGQVVHAKCAVADNCLAFITSANLSDAAMERNMELGVLVKDGYLPYKLHCHLESLIVTNTIQPI